MSIWGKIIGGTAGFAIGGPIGALLGALAGHAVDTYTEMHSPDEDQKRQVAFTIALIALSAKMAKADGIVTKDEIIAFRQKVDIPKKDLPHVGRIWDLARQTPEGFDQYALQVAEMFPKNSPVLEQMMALLFFIARADGIISPQENQYLEQVAHILGYDAQGFERLNFIYGQQDASPYHILGVSPDDDDATIRQAWVTLARNHHPDLMMAQGLPEEFVRAANDELAIINKAYDDIKAMRSKNKSGGKAENKSENGDA